jgi:hypothetical protein
MLWFNVGEDTGTGLERKSGDSNIGMKDCQGNVTVAQRKLLKIWENYITEI